MVFSRAAMVAMSATIYLAIGPKVYAQTPHAEEQTLKIAMASNSFAFGGLRIAEHAGLFQKNGINPVLTVMENANASISALLSGSVDLAISAPDDVLFAAAKGQPIAIVLNLFRGLNGSLIVSKSLANRSGVLADASLDEKLRALNGATIAVPSPTSVLIPIKAPVEAAGGSLTFTYMGQPLMAAALQNGAVDAIMAGSPYWEAAVSSGDATLWLNGPAGEFPEEVTPNSVTVMSTLSSYAAENPETIQRIRDVFADLHDLVRNNPEKAISALKEAYPNSDHNIIEDVFEQYSTNWTQPEYQLSDVERHIDLMLRIRQSDDLLKIDPKAVIVP